MSVRSGIEHSLISSLVTAVLLFSDLFAANYHLHYSILL